MTIDPHRRRRPARLTNRSGERYELDRLVESVCGGASRVLVVCGDPGVGKTVLLDYLAGRAATAGCRVARVAGVESEMELAYSGLHLLCAPLLRQAGRLPEPQREALRIAFGVAAGPPPDRFLVGLAVLSLLSETAGERPLLCVIDDAQWLDQASSQVLGVTGRRLAADPVGLVFGARDPGADLARLPELEVSGLHDDDARRLLESALPGPMDRRVRDLIVAETRGNPLALLELPRDRSPAELAGGFGLPGEMPLAGRIEDSFARQLAALPPATQFLLQLSSADPSGNRSLVWRAAKHLEIPGDAELPAVEAGLVEFGARVRFRHPLARSAAYRSAQFSVRQQIHAALAQVTDLRTDPDRRAWHRAAAAAEPDEEVAAELELSAGRAQARGGRAAAAAFLGRAMRLTADPARRAARALAAAEASLQAGAFRQALDLLEAAEGGRLDKLPSARVDLLRGQIAFASSLGGDASLLLLRAAKRFEPLDLDLARETYLGAWMAAMFAGRLARSGDLLEVCRAARRLPPLVEPARTVDLVLEGLTLVVTDGPAAAAPSLRRAVHAFADVDVPAEEALRWGWLAQAAASALWDDDAWRALLVRQVGLARDAGAFDELPIMLGALGTAAVWSGDFAGASALIVEADTVCEVTGSPSAPFTAMMLASWQGREGEAMPLIEATIAAAATATQGVAIAYANWAAAVLHNGFSRYEVALRAALQASEDRYVVHISMWALPELVEAAVRTGHTDLAISSTMRLATFTHAAGTDFGLGIQARCDALMSEPDAADELYREAITRLGRTQVRTELARAQLLYGEWLRRQNRRLDARTQLKTAYTALSEMGAAGFAERARRELTATGETSRKRGVEISTALTAQESHIARLGVEGRTNAEIGAQLYLSPRTVEWHLRKVFTKLGITSRRELRNALNKGPN